MVEWLHGQQLVSYPDALEFMQQRVTAIQNQQAGDLVWLLEHPPLYTAGTSARNTDLLDNSRFPVYEAGRGGQYTYHGPGQRVAYVMLDLNSRQKDIRAYIQALENWIIDTLAYLNIEAFQREGRIGIWVNHQDREEKIAAIGVRVSKWVTYHGIALNVDPRLDHFTGIVPCGLNSFGVTSLRELGISLSLEEVDEVLKIMWAQQPFLANTSI